jgi:predicted Zn-dependent protease with MMP-like domain
VAARAGTRDDVETRGHYKRIRQANQRGCCSNNEQVTYLEAQVQALILVEIDHAFGLGRIDDPMEMVSMTPSSRKKSSNPGIE